jgi:hypothetical protein
VLVTLKLNNTQIYCDLKLLEIFAHRIIYEISSSHGGEYDVQNCLLGCTAV